MRNREGRPSSVQLAGWPSVKDFVPGLGEDAEDLSASFAALLDVRDVVTKAIEDARNEKIINKSQEAALRITAPAQVVSALSRFTAAELEEFFIVAEVVVEEGGEEAAAEVTKTTAAKCPRCWNHRELGSDAAHPDVCARCAAVLSGMGE